MFNQKIRAAGVHFCFCIVVAGLALSLVYFGWYEGVLAEIQNVGRLLFIILLVDIVLGPLLTFVVYKADKKSLKFDLSVIAAVQLAFLTYGLLTVYSGRPAFLVFAVDRFEAVSINDWSPEDRMKASPEASVDWFRPVVRAALLPVDPVERNAILMSSTSGGADVTQMPQFYKDYPSYKHLVVQRLQSIDTLRRFNAMHQAEIDNILAQLKRSSEDVGYLPLKGKVADATVLLERKSGEILGIYRLNPWP